MGGNGFQAIYQLLESFAQESVPLVLRGLIWKCWKCKTINHIPALVHPESDTHFNSVIDTIEGIRLEYVKEFLWKAGDQRHLSIKKRYSKSLNSSYLSHGCVRCDALAGQFFLRENFVDIAVAEKVPSLPIIIELERPLTEYIALKASRDYGIDIC